jgi:hypothetical protein
LQVRLALEFTEGFVIQVRNVWSIGGRELRRRHHSGRSQLVNMA